MAWVEIHQKLLTDPALFDFASVLGCEQPEAIGRLTIFWLWCVDHAEDGDLRKFNDNQLAMAAGLSRTDGKLFVDALHAGHFVEREPYFRLHNWWKYVGRLLQAKYKKEEYSHKWQRVKSLYESQIPSPKPATVVGTVQGTVPGTVAFRATNTTNTTNITKGGGATDGGTPSQPRSNTTKVSNTNKLSPVDSAIYKALRENKWFPIADNQLRIAGKLLCQKHKRWQASTLGALWYAVEVGKATDPGPFAIACLKGRAAASETFERYTRMAQEKINELEEELLNGITTGSECPCESGG